MLPFPVDICIHLQGSARHVYVEVVLHGETEGKFLEDPEAHRDEMVGQVSKLGGFSYYAAKSNERLTIPLIELSSLLDPRRYRS